MSAGRASSFGAMAAAAGLARVTRVNDGGSDLCNELTEEEIEKVLRG